jgi:hypothetical protein
LRKIAETEMDIAAQAPQCAVLLASGRCTTCIVDSPTVLAMLRA